MSWWLVYLLMGGLIAVVALIAFRAPDTPRPDADRLHKELAEPGAIEPTARGIALAIVGVGWAWAIFTIGRFMVSMLAPATGREAAVGRRLHQALWAVDHLRDGDRAADRRGGDSIG